MKHHTRTITCSFLRGPLGRPFGAFRVSDEHESVRVVHVWRFRLTIHRKETRHDDNASR